MLEELGLSEELDDELLDDELSGFVVLLAGGSLLGLEAAGAEPPPPHPVNSIAVTAAVATVQDTARKSFFFNRIKSTPFRKANHKLYRHIRSI